MIKPILVPTDDKHSGLDIDPQNGDNLSKESAQYHHKNPQVIILIDTEAEIVEGDLAYSHKGTPNIQKVEKNLNTSEYRKSVGWTKIISSTNKSHNLPQPSKESIQLIINYYNEHKCMPESIEVEES